jgi:hypothetical protein
MIALVLAAGITAFSSPLNVQAAAICSRIMAQTSYEPALLMRPQDWAAARPRKLGDLPDAQHEYAVLRTVGGCMVPAPIGYHPAAK